MSSRQFVGTIKTVRLAGDYPDLEVQVVFAMPLRNAADVAFLAAVKQHGQAVIEVSSAQEELPLDEAGETFHLEGTTAPPPRVSG
ncbi:MAG: hypothetical protein A2V88_08765 [Elusimicrobia bacterium RBG_16_66_12]|nr:MAG: hypothetical protein A2V88_08765 [Elusimicrobia bacterium RBG_16_66_12]